MGEAEVVGLLLNHGAVLDTPDESGQPQLALAEALGHDRVVALLAAHRDTRGTFTGHPGL